MSLIERYRDLYEHEKDSNNKMLAMLEAVPESSRSDARFQRAVTLAGHLAACRENWLECMAKDGRTQVAWFDDSCDFTTLRSRFSALESGWTSYLASLDDGQLASDFTFPVGEDFYSLPTQVQIEQLVGHAAYHRGQVALLVDQLGGETVDTDYVYWKIPESA